MIHPAENNDITILRCIQVSLRQNRFGEALLLELLKNINDITKPILISNEKIAPEPYAPNIPLKPLGEITRLAINGEKN